MRCRRYIDSWRSWLRCFAGCSADEDARAGRSAASTDLGRFPRRAKVVDESRRVRASRRRHAGALCGGLARRAGRAAISSSSMQRTRGVALARQPTATGDGQRDLISSFRPARAPQVEEGYSLHRVPRANRRLLAQPSRPFLWRSDAVAAARARRRSAFRRCTIEDAPRFRWRGLMLDSARHYQSPEFIKRLIDTMALHKLNVLHWHLTDDQAWRLEIKKYPKLTEVGAWRVPAGAAAAADIDPATGRPRLYGGFYSQDQVREHRRVRGRAPHHDRARDRDARPRERGDRRVSAARRSTGKPIGRGARRLGRLSQPVQRRGVDVRVPRGRARRSAWRCSRASTSTSAATRR